MTHFFTQMRISSSNPKSAISKFWHDGFLSGERGKSGRREGVSERNRDERKKERGRKTLKERAAVADERNAERARHKSCVLYKKKYYPCQGKVGCPKMNDNRLIKNNGRLNDK